MNTFGVERRHVRTAAIGARIGVRGPLIALASAAVFAFSYAISGSSHPAAAKAQAPPNLPVANVTAVVPAMLHPAAPIPIVEAPPPPRPAPKPAPQHASAPAASTRTSEPLAAPPPTTPARSNPEPAHVRTAPPTAPSRTEAPPPQSSGGSSGGTFESSG
jgi:hypothetical protein